MNPNQALWEKGDFTRIAATMRESGDSLVNSLGTTKGLKVLDRMTFASGVGSYDYGASASAGALCLGLRGELLASAWGVGLAFGASGAPISVSHCTLL